MPGPGASVIPPRRGRRAASRWWKWPRVSRPPSTISQGATPPVPSSSSPTVWRSQHSCVAHTARSLGRAYDLIPENAHPLVIEWPAPIVQELEMSSNGLSR